MGLCHMRPRQSWMQYKAQLGSASAPQSLHIQERDPSDKSLGPYRKRVFECVSAGAATTLTNLATRGAASQAEAEAESSRLMAPLDVDTQDELDYFSAELLEAELEEAATITADSNPDGSLAPNQV